MTRPFGHLLSPLKLRRTKVKNRLAFGAHVTNFSDDGLPGERHRAYYAARARGGVGMIVVDPLPVHVTSQVNRAGLRPGDDGIIPGLAQVAAAGHAEGAIMILQLMHVGAHGQGEVSFAPAWSPSGLPSQRSQDGSHEMTEAEIMVLIDAYANAARRAQAAGFDGVELAAGGNVLIDQFWSRLSNRRQDRWGGSFENRLRFSAEVQRRIRREVGGQFLIGMTMSSDPAIPGALSHSELGRIAAWHESHGVIDYISVSTGSLFDPASLAPGALGGGASGVEAAAVVKAAVSRLPVGVAGGVHDLAMAEKVISRGKADFAVLVRSLIADPKLPAKLAEDRADDIRPCIACNQLCVGRRNRDYWISCLVNPGVGREVAREQLDNRVTPEAKSVLVVGGGLAGLEAARVAAARGHRVRLVEGRDHFGGQFALAGQQPGREKNLELIDWYEAQLLKQQVRLGLETWITAQEIVDLHPDVVILATGALPAGTGFQRPIAYQKQLPGIEDPAVAPVEAVLAGETAWTSEDQPRRLLLLDDDGHWAGVGTALFLAERGHSITLATRYAVAGYELMGDGEFSRLRARLKAKSITELPSVALMAWRAGTAELRSLQDGRTWSEEFDGLVLATTNRANDSLEKDLMARDLANLGIDCRVVGDAAGARRAHMAVYEGRAAVLDL